LAVTEPTVFVVDDDDAVRDSLTILLESAGYRAEPYGSGRALLEAVGPQARGCIIADVRMPGMDGLELQQALAQRGVGLPVIIMTGHGDVPIAVRAMKAGAVDFVEKPFAEDAMLSAVAAAMQREQQASRGSGVRLDAAALERLSQLTPRERDVLEALVSGHPNKVIAHRLQISPRTVEIHRARIMEKMAARSLSHLVRVSLAAGVEPRED
jgi:two-component system response regulator FixJ